MATTGSGITAYSVKTKTKNVPMIDPVIDVKSGRYIASGKDSAGNKMAAIMSKATAEGHIKSGAAKKEQAGVNPATEFYRQHPLMLWYKCNKPCN